MLEPTEGSLGQRGDIKTISCKRRKCLHDTISKCKRGTCKRGSGLCFIRYIENRPDSGRPSEGVGTALCIGALSDLLGQDTVINDASMSFSQQLGQSPLAQGDSLIERGIVITVGD
ncbi:hypothetical protein RRG08_009657 [Elysia crispata]|uniref:Uncharacterized protein n=1 Tax=Elysia crispata TaxID=231223 RepID=A0AAE1DNC9_9GAST|nr:hypothetical protein RRG08_009657 [Elysia crispata]